MNVTIVLLEFPAHLSHHTVLIDRVCIAYYITLDRKVRLISRLETIFISCLTIKGAILNLDTLLVNLRSDLELGTHG